MQDSSHNCMRSSLKLELACGDYLGSHLDTFHILHLQQSYCGASNRRASHQDPSIEFEMFCPDIGARVKEAHYRERFGVKRGEIWPLVTISIRASKRQVVDRIVAEMLLGEDMLNVKCQILGSSLRQTAILTTVSGAATNIQTDCNIHA